MLLVKIYDATSGFKFCKILALRVVKSEFRRPSIEDKTAADCDLIAGTLGANKLGCITLTDLDLGVLAVSTQFITGHMFHERGKQV